MKIQVKQFTVNKRFPLTISRGTTAKTTNISIKILQDDIEGWGEASPFGVGNHAQSTEIITNQLQQIAPVLEPFTPLQRQEIEEILTQQQVASSVKAALDMAMYDWLGKSIKLPKVIQLYETVASAGGAFGYVPVVGIALNTADLNESTAKQAIAQTTAETNLPCTDPVRFGAGILLDAILKHEGNGG